MSKPKKIFFKRMEYKIDLAIKKVLSYTEINRRIFVVLEFQNGVQKEFSALSSRSLKNNILGYIKNVL